MEVSEQAIVTLLDDTDSMSVAEVMRLVMDQYADPNEFISRHQDDENQRVRRHVQQLSRLLVRKNSYRDLVMGVRSRKLSFWDGVFLVNDLADTQINRAYLSECFEEYASEILRGIDFDVRATTSQMVTALQSSTLFVGRGADFFDVGSLLLSEVMVTGQCHPLLMCEIVRQLGQRVGWFASTMIFGGLFLLRTPDDMILSPDSGWNAVPDMTSTMCRPCTEHEMLSTYLALLHVSSVVTRRPIGVYNFTTLLSEIGRVDQSKLPYPLGDRRYVPSRHPSSELGNSSGASQA